MEEKAPPAISHATIASQLTGGQCPSYQDPIFLQSSKTTHQFLVVHMLQLPEASSNLVRMAFPPDLCTQVFTSRKLLDVL